MEVDGVGEDGGGEDGGEGEGGDGGGIERWQLWRGVRFRRQRQRPPPLAGKDCAGDKGKDNA